MIMIIRAFSNSTAYQKLSLSPLTPSTSPNHYFNPNPKFLHLDPNFTGPKFQCLLSTSTMTILLPSPPSAYPTTCSPRSSKLQTQCSTNPTLPPPHQPCPPPHLLPSHQPNLLLLLHPNLSHDSHLSHDPHHPNLLPLLGCLYEASLSHAVTSVDPIVTRDQGAMVHNMQVYPIIKTFIGQEVKHLPGLYFLLWHDSRT